jgi:YD repeat-containing protein
VGVHPLYAIKVLSCPDAFVTKLDASGSALVYSTYLGGSDEDYGKGIALEGSGAAYAIGYTFSSDFPVTPGALDIVFGGAGERDAFLAKISEAAPPPVTELSYNWHFAYDGLSRLVSACSYWDGGTSTCLGDSFEYTYDGAGNLLSFSRWSGSAVETVDFVYNQANQIVCQDGDANGACGDAGDISYSYDAYGNLTSDGVKTYAYDAENRLTSVMEGASTTTYTYNGDGDRISQTVGGMTTSYVLDTATSLTMVLAETTGTDTIYYLHGLDLVAQNDGVSTEYFGYDGLGSVRQVLDRAGSVLFTQVFDPYGNPYASAGADSTSWGFTGEQTDSNGLIFLRARYYDPRQGKFLQRDP